MMMLVMVAMAWKDPNKDTDGDGLRYVEKGKHANICVHGDSKVIRTAFISLYK